MEHMEHSGTTGQEVLASKFLNDNVRVYLVNGAIISGKLANVDRHSGYIEDPTRDKEAVVTWRHVISITRY